MCRKYDRTFALRLLGALTITVGLAYANELGCRTVENISSILPAYTYVNVKPGDDFNVTCCFINNASCINVVEKYKTKIPSLKEVNASIKEVTIRNIKYKKKPYEFYCRCNKDAFKITYVSVGLAPKPVRNLFCVVLDFVEMECTVELYYESVETRYTFLLDGLQTLQASQINYGDSPKYTFKLTDKQYDIDRSIYNFTLNSSNRIGPFSENKSVQQYNIVKPQLQNVTVTNITSDGVSLVWDVLNSAAYTKYPTGGLFFNISLKAEKYDFFQKEFSIENHNDHFWIDISNLYPYVEYRVHIHANTRVAHDNERLWSNQFEQTFRTLAKIPSKPPYIEVGNFYIDPEDKSLSLFWQQIPEFDHNGPNFSYEISGILENGQEIEQNLDKNTNFASFNVDLKNTSKYAFQLRSRNEEGVSHDASVLKIGPRYTNITHDEQKHALTKVYNQNYTVSWLRPTNFTALSSFTLFWCSAKVESMEGCKGPMEFINLDRNVLNYTTDISNTTNFALSENYYDNTYSSGMMWFTCSRNSETDSFQIQFDYPLICEENNITIRWIPECWSLSIIDRYMVTYCEDNTTDYCKNETISKNARSYTINGLKSSSAYKITVTSILNTGLEVKSETINGRTKIAKDTNSTIKVIIFACYTVIGAVGFIILALTIKKRFFKMMDIKTIIPGEDNEENLSDNPFGNNYPIDTVNCSEKKSSSFIGKRILEKIFLWNSPTRDTVQNNRKRQLFVHNSNNNAVQNSDILSTTSDGYITYDQASRPSVSGLSSTFSEAHKEKERKKLHLSNSNRNALQILRTTSSNYLSHPQGNQDNILNTTSEGYISCDQASRPSVSGLSSTFSEAHKEKERKKLHLSNSNRNALQIPRTTSSNYLSHPQGNQDNILNTTSEGYISCDQASRPSVSGLSSTFSEAHKEKERKKLHLSNSNRNAVQIPSTTCSGYISTEQAQENQEREQLLAPSSYHVVVQNGNILNTTSEGYISYDQVSRPSVSGLSSTFSEAHKEKERKKLHFLSNSNRNALQIPRTTSSNYLSHPQGNEDNIESNSSNRSSIFEKINFRNLLTSDRVQNKQEREAFLPNSNHNIVQNSDTPSTTCSGYISTEQARENQKREQLLVPISNHIVVQNGNIPSNRSDESIFMNGNDCVSLIGESSRSDEELNDDLINDVTTSSSGNVVNGVHNVELHSVPLVSTQEYEQTHHDDNKINQLILKSFSGYINKLSYLKNHTHNSKE